MWELIFMMLILKIPIVYLILVVYWAIRSEPKPVEFHSAWIAAMTMHLESQIRRTSR